MISYLFELLQHQLRPFKLVFHVEQLHLELTDASCLLILQLLAHQFLLPLLLTLGHLTLLFLKFTLLLELQLAHAFLLGRLLPCQTLLLCFIALPFFLLLL